MSTIQTESTLFIDGEWSSANGDGIEALNPATEEVLATVPSATEADVDRALDAAQRAKAAWAHTPAPARAAVLRSIADVIEQNADYLARVLVAEGGKPLSQAQGEVEETSGYIRYVAEWDRRIEGEIVPSDNADEQIQLLRVPVGVVSAICPWNFPVVLYFRKAAPALLAGNTVVIKPSEVTPLSSIELTRLIADAVELPAGVLNFVTGSSETGRAMVRSPKTDMIAMTGHRDTGKKIMADAAQNLTRVSVELGGKAPAIVLADADLDQAVEAIVTARHYFSGQVCTCAERVYVHDTIHESFVSRYCDAVRQLRIGDPRGDVDIGPLVNAAQREKNEEAVDRAINDGARVALGGSRPSGSEFERGFWYSPTVLVDVTPEMRVMREETFGPVTPIMPISSLDEALQQANDTRYGLSAYIFTSNYRDALRATMDLDFGEIYVNRTLGEALQGFHIGHKESGLGGEDGKHGILKYTQIRTVYHSYA